MKYFLICACLLTMMASANAQKLRVHLLAEATVQEARVRLSDLLPPDAEARLKAIAGGIFLGRAPQAGSVRVFTGNELREAMVESAYTSEIEIPQQVIVRRLGWPLETETVRRALVQSKLTHQIDLAQKRLTPPPGFTTVVPAPKLEVMAIAPNPDHSGLQARIRCRERTACGSFLVEIASSQAAGGIRSRQHKLASEEVLTPNLLSSGPVFVQPGRMALLVIDGDGFRVTQPVMPLKPAAVGELVRASDARSHRSWLTQVSGDGSLRLSGTTVKEEAR